MTKLPKDALQPQNPNFLPKKNKFPFWRTVLTVAMLGILSACANPAKSTEPAPELQSYPAESGTPTPEPEFSSLTLPEQMKQITPELREQVISDRTEFWNSPEGESLYPLIYYEPLSTDDTLRAQQLDQPINDNRVYIFGGGFDGIANSKRNVGFFGTAFLG